jgi:hypothetical protein
MATAWGGDYSNSLNGGTASGVASTAFGIKTTASGYASTALGEYAMAGDGTAADGKGDYSVAFGLTNTNTATYPQITGAGDFGVFMQDQHNDVINANNVMTLMGGSLYINPASGGGTTVSSVAQALQVVGSATVSGDFGIANTSPGALLDIGSAGATLGTMRLEGNTSGYVQVQPSAAAGSWTMTLPNSGGTSGFCLVTDGSGNTSWASCTGGGMTTIDLGMSASATNPQRSGQIGTGLFSAVSNTVSIAGGGADVTDFSAAGVNIAVAGGGLAINSPFGDENVVWVPPSSADPAGFSLALGQNTLVSDTNTGGGTNGEYDTGVGQEALYANSTGAYNTALGAAAMQYNTTGEDNTALGYNALNANTTGTNNTVIGSDVASATLNGGSSNILIGTSSAVDTPLATTSNFLNIGNTIFATGTNAGTVSAPAGNVGIGTTNPTAMLDIGGGSHFFAPSPASNTTINGAQGSGVTTITVASTAGYPSSGYLAIGQESIQYTGKTATTFTGCTRGLWGSTAAALTNAEVVYLYVQGTLGAGGTPVYLMNSGAYSSIGYSFVSPTGGVKLNVNGNISAATISANIFGPGDSPNRGKSMARSKAAVLMRCNMFQARPC